VKIKNLQSLDGTHFVLCAELAA